MRLTFDVNIKYLASMVRAVPPVVADIFGNMVCGLARP